MPSVRALVTGAGGFCGRHLLSYLQAQNIEVFTLGARATSDNHWFAGPIDLEPLVATLGKIKPNYIIHLAGTASVSDISLCYTINTLYAANLLKALEVVGLDCPVLLIGTAAEYGFVEDDQLPITEETPARPAGHYGVSKLAQTLMGLVHSKNGQPLVMVRPFNIIGPGMPDTVSVQAFARQISEISMNRQPPFIEVGNLDSARDFVAVDEAVKIYWQLIQAPAAYGEIINVCAGQVVVMRDLLARLINLAGIDIEVRVDPARIKQIDIPVSYGDPEKLRSLIGWVPDTVPDTTLRQILDGADRH